MGAGFANTGFNTPALKTFKVSPWMNIVYLYSSSIGLVGYPLVASARWTMLPSLHGQIGVPYER